MPQGGSANGSRECAPDDKLGVSRRAILLNKFNLIWVVQPCYQKFSPSRLTQITSISLAVSPHMRGVSRSSRTRGGMRWTRMALLTRAPFRGRRSRVVLTPRRWRQVGGGNSAGDGDKKARSPGRVRRKPLKPLACGNAGCSRWTCGGYTRVPPTLCTRGCGCSGNPAFPTPSLGERYMHNSGASRRGNAGVCLILAV
jgi:hypothetical protein